MAFDKIVGVDGTTYQFPTLVRTRISDNIKLNGSLENLAVKDAMSASLALKSDTTHNHNLADLTNNGIDYLSDVEIGVVGPNGIALDDKHTLQYELSTNKWRNKVASGGVTVGDSRPTSPIPGDAWFDSNDGTLYVYYADANTTQWVQVKANSALEGTILARLGALESRATALEATPDYSPNYLINGGFDIWQRGTSAVNGITNGAFHPDRWMFYTDGVGTCNSSRVDVSAQGVGSQYAWRLERTAGTNRWVAIQVIEGALALVGKSVTLSFYVRKGAGLTSNIVVDLSTRASKFGAGVDYTNVTFQNSSLSTSTFTRCSVTLPITTATSSAGADIFEIEIQGNQAGAANAYFEITGVQLEVGSVPTPFRRAGLTLQGELAACQRYYYRATSTSAYGVIGTGKVYSTYNANIYIPFPVPMRAIPGTIDWNGVTAPFQMEWGATSTTITAVSLNSFTNNNRIGSIDVGSGGSMTVANYVVLLANNNTNAYVGFSAEL